MRPFIYLGFSALLIALDQLSKWAVTELFIRPLVEGDGALPHDVVSWFANAPLRLTYAEKEVLPFFNIVMVWNQGISFGLFNAGTDYGPLLLVALSLAITFWFLVWLFRRPGGMPSLGIALVIAGAIGNVIDRLRFGAVIDFLDFHIMGYHWPAFNVADSCIVIGVILLIIYSLFFEKSLQEPASSP